MSNRKQLRKGRPKDITPVVFDRNDPDNYPTVTAYLQATGRLTQTSNLVKMKARSLFYQYVDVEAIAVELCVEVGVIDRWSLIFGWEEERDAIVFEQFRKVGGVKELYGSDVGKRHDRIAGSIEQMAERLLNKSRDGSMNARDLKTLASIIESTQTIRRTSRGISDKVADKTQQPAPVQVNLAFNLDKLAGALEDVIERPVLVEASTKTMAVGREDYIGRDTEFEEALDGPTKTIQE